MCKIIKKWRKLDDGTTITTYTCEVGNACVLTVEAGTNGYFGGDSGHGSRTYIRIHNAGGADMEAHSYDGNSGFEVALGGDHELSTMIRGLDFITMVLKEESKDLTDLRDWNV